MIRSSLLAAAIVATLACLSAPAHAVTVFNDTFATSTLNPATMAAPTGTSTSYSVVSSKTATASSIGPGSLKLNSVQTSAGITELQARFASTPLTLAAEGDYLELTMTFISTKVNNLNGGGNFAVGLYKSGGVDPVPGGQMNNGQLGIDPVTQIAFANGFVQNWEGYHSRNTGTAGSWQFFYRPPQADTVNENQELLQNNVGNGAYDTPGGPQITPQAPPTLSLANGSTYTYTFRVSMAAGGLLDISDKIYEGAAVTETPLFSHTVQSTAATPLVTQFDALAIGMRPSNVAVSETVPVGDPVGPHIMDFSRIQIDTNLVVAPPADNANFNADAQVDGDDFLIWQRGLGGPASQANGDANNNGTIDGTDLGIWRNHFGQATASSVPEPTCSALAAIASLLFAAARRRS